MKKLAPQEEAKLDKYLISGGYHPVVFADERHAYLLAGGEDLEDVGVNVERVMPIHLALNEAYQQSLENKGNKRQ